MRNRTPLQNGLLFGLVAGLVGGSLWVLIFVIPGVPEEALVAPPEHREAHASATPQVILKRQARLPLTRVAPSDYAEAAAKLRRVDPLEAAEIRVQLPAKN